MCTLAAIDLWIVRKQWIAVLIVVCLVMLSTAKVIGADPSRVVTADESEFASSMADDAGLNDIQFIGSQSGWAVGDCGTIWHSIDAGESWQRVSSPIDCSFTSVCFLTDRIGWIAGAGTQPYSGYGYGVVLATTNGGQSWDILAGPDSNNRVATKIGTAATRVDRFEPNSGELSIERPETDPYANEQAAGDATASDGTGTSSRRMPTVPRIAVIRFFGPRTGIAVGDSNGDFPSGVFRTDDGGRTWLPMPSEFEGSWTAAGFPSPETGVVVGTNARTAAVAGQQLLPSPNPMSGLYAFHDVTANRSGGNWLVGDGGLVLKSDDGGVSWAAPPSALPRDLRNSFDFRCVAAQGNSVWIAGSPGSMVWHSADGGRSWSQFKTGETVPLNRIRFASETSGWAVGALGAILHTQDGGQTWRAVRAGGRRTALLSVVPRPERVSLQLIAKQAADLGYRSAVLLPARWDVGVDGYRYHDLDRRLHDAVKLAGGSAGLIDWRLPIDVPGTEHDRARLVSEWNKRTEGRLGEILVGTFVRHIRTWRPNVIVLDETAADDAVAELVHEALLHAVQQAADETRFVEQQMLAGLEPWKVSRVSMRLPDGSEGHASVAAYEFLPHLKTTVQSAAAAGLSLLSDGSSTDALRQTWRHIPLTSDARRAPHHDFFAGIVLMPGSDARRRIPSLSDEPDAEGQQRADRQRNLRAWTEQFGQDATRAAALIGELRSAARGLTDNEAALQLMHLAEDLKRHNHREQAATVLTELVEQYPDHPASGAAMEWLFHWLASTEIMWQRLQADGFGGSMSERNGQIVLTGNSSSPGLAGSQPSTGRHRDERTVRIDQWRQQAASLAGIIRETRPMQWNSPDLQFAAAAVLRQRGGSAASSRVLQNGTGFSQYWKQTADCELWAANPVAAPPRNVALCRATAVPPHLDGILSDPCWQTATELRLLSEQDAQPGVTLASESAIVMVSHDSQFLYLAASVPYAGDGHRDEVQTSGRTHDTDLREFDRLSFAFDIDRDYSTWYTFNVDQRGCTFDMCWDDASWDPKWFVATVNDRGHWRIEVAIPFEELLPGAPAENSLWALGIQRVIPGVGAESWTAPVASAPRPESFGMLRFD